MDFSSMLNDWLDQHPPEAKDEHLTDDREARRNAAERRAALRRMKPQATLDLHGLTVTDALERADRFLEEAKASGMRKVLIIHGKGIHSRDGDAVLKSAVRAHLRTNPLAGEIGIPDRSLGGEGASWVVLR